MIRLVELASDMTESVALCDSKDVVPTGSKITEPAAAQAASEVSRPMMMAMMTIAASSADAQHHRIECPLEASAEWGLPKPAPLDQVAVLPQPVCQPVEDRAPPAGVPDRGFARGNV
jgi:hypothetical protein